MTTEIFYVKFGDTVSTLVATLFNPDGTVFDLTNQTKINFNVKLNDGTIVTRDTMTVIGDPKAGQVQYQWITDDWDGAADNFQASPAEPFSPSDSDHVFEIEVVAPAGTLTFPNDGYHVLRITAEIA